MKSFRSTENRLSAIEGRRGLGVIRLTFADGSTRAIRVARDFQLALFEDTCAWQRAYPPVPPEGIVLPQPPPEPTTPSDKLIALLGEAVSIEGEHVIFLRTIHAMCQQMSERKKEREKASGNALTPQGGN
jgi:hypothetical protein